MFELKKAKPIPPDPNKIAFLQHVKYEHLIAGLTGGVVSNLVLHPLDLLKIRFEVNDGVRYKLHYRGIFHSLSTIYSQEGIRGLYQGALPSTLGAGASWGFYFYFYTAIKVIKQKGDLNSPLTPIQHLVAASEAGFLSLLLTNPIWVAKTRLCLQSATTLKLNAEVYTGMFDVLLKLYRTEGIRGWYRGFLPGIFGISHGAIQFMVYEEMKNYYNMKRGMAITTKLGVMEYLTFAAISKAVAVVTTYPYQVMRARMQNQFHSYNNTWDCVRKLCMNEGWSSFYKGLGTNLVRVLPATMITFIIYENVSQFLIGLNK